MAMAMASGEQLKNAKIAVLDLINTNKEILFGKLSESVSREAKESKWAEVAEHAHTLGAFPWHRSWDYLRDTTWQNWRKRFVEKREKMEKFEKTGEGPRIVFDEADLIIMEILDVISAKNGPYTSAYLPASSNSSMLKTDRISSIHDLLEIEMKNELGDVTDGGSRYQSDNHGMGLNGTGGSNTDYQLVEDGNNESQEMMYDQHTSYQSESNNDTGQLNENTSDLRPKIVTTSSLSGVSRATFLRKSAYAAVRNSNARKRPAPFVTTSGAAEPADRALEALRCRKIRAELELLQRETYKKDLEILQLERSLGLPPSELTRKFYRVSRNNQRTF